jgi:ATP-dependent DNA ligase
MAGESRPGVRDRGYVPASSTFDSLLVGYYDGRDLMYAGPVRAGLVAESRRALLSHFAVLGIERCPFRNLPERTKGRWGEGLTAEDMDDCRWLVPRLVAAVEFLEWTPQLRLRHPRFVGLRADKDPNEVVRE